MKNTVNTLIGAFLASLIGFLTATLAVFQQAGVENFSDVPTSTWVVLAIGATVAFLKDYQAVVARRVLSTMTGVPETPA